MKFSLSSIRSKIWLCVAIALTGYLLATLSSFYTNIRHYQNLSHLHKEHYPLATLSAQLENTFDLQVKKFGDAFVIGEPELLILAHALKTDILKIIDEILLILSDSTCSDRWQQDVMKIREDYVLFSTQAEETYTLTSLENLSRDYQIKIQKLGQTLGSLEKDIQSLNNTVSQTMTAYIEENQKKGLYTILYMGILFLAVLLCVTVIANRVSSKLLITPISNILENINRFSKGQQVIEPPATVDKDEVGQLATSFWGLTEKLKTTTVSKIYVDNIIHNMSEALLILKPDMTIEAINRRGIELFGYTKKEIIGRQAELLFANPEDDEITTGDDEISAFTITDILSKGSVRNINTTCRTKTGKTFPAHFSGSLMENQTEQDQGIICIFNDVTKLKLAEEKLRKMAHFDPLTGLANRNLFFQFLDHTLHASRRHDRIFAVLYLDLDKFKPINDNFGHDAGDHVLQEVSKRLSSITRADDLVARVGGDEFVVLLTALRAPENAEYVAKKIIQKILTPFKVNGASHHLGVSIGISVYPEDGENVELLISQADTAMYQAKENGGEKFIRFKKGE